MIFTMEQMQAYGQEIARRCGGLAGVIPPVEIAQKVFVEMFGVQEHDGEYEIILKSIPPSRLQHSVNVIRKFTGLGLEGANEFRKRLPRALSCGSKFHIDRIAEELQGCQFEIVEV